MMRMICCMQMERIDGLTEKELIIRILMVQVVHCLLRLLLILQKDSHWRSLWSVRKSISLGALAAMLDLGKGSGPMDHGFAIQNEYTKEAEA